MKRTIMWCHRSNFNNSVGVPPTEAGESASALLLRDKTPALLMHQNYATKFNDTTIVWFV